MEALQEQWVSINGYLGKVLKREVFCKAKIALCFFFILALKNNLRAKLCCVCSAPERHLTALACGLWLFHCSLHPRPAGETQEPGKGLCSTSSSPPSHLSKGFRAQLRTNSGSIGFL